MTQIADKITTGEHAGRARLVPCLHLLEPPAPECAPRCWKGYQPGRNQCPACPHYAPGLTEQERIRCEVWTRVMGYHRPVSAFNAGKRAEHAERRLFAEPAIERAPLLPYHIAGEGPHD